MTFTDLLAAFVKNILSLSRVSFVLFRKPVLLQVRDALLQSLPLRWSSKKRLSACSFNSAFRTMMLLSNGCVGCRADQTS